MKKPRLTYLDISKGLGILMITYGHVTDFGNPVDNWMSIFKITIFYIVSGYLLAMGKNVTTLNTRQYAKKLFGSLMVPYFAFSILGFFYRLALLKLKHGKGYRGFILDYGYTTISLRGYSTLWFLPTLFFGSLFLFWVLKHKNKVLMVLTFTLPLVIGHLSSEWLSRLSKTMADGTFKLVSYPTLMISKSIIAFWFVAIGYVSYQFLPRLKGKTQRFGVGIALSLITVYISTIATSIDFNSMDLGTIPALFYVGGITGSIGAILVFEYAANFFSFPILTYFGRNSLILMSIQRIFCIINIAVAGWASIARTPKHMCFRYYFDSLAALAIILLIAYPITEYINAKLPFLIGKKKRPVT